MCYMITCIHLLLYTVIVTLLLSFRTSGFRYVIHHTLIYVSVQNILGTGFYF